ncbi:MAG: alpha/beta fold hydrolase [Hyphomicrobiales bacterium]
MKKIFILLVLVVASNFGINAANDNIKVNVIGKGKDIIFLPGFACPGSVWFQVVDSLKQNYKCHVVSYPQYGKRIPGEDNWFEDLCEYVKLYVEENNLSNFTIVGHSMGGNIAMRLNLEDSERFKNLIIVESLPCTGALMNPNYKSEDIDITKPANIGVLESDDKTYHAIANQMANFMVKSPEYKEKIASYIIDTDRKTYVYGYTELLKGDLREDIKDIKGDILVLGAGFPSVDQIKWVYESQYQAMPEKTIEYAEGSMHFIMFDKPLWLIDKINQYLSKKTN